MSLLRCPRCHKGALFSGLLTVVDQCGACGLALREHEQGDGPAVFAILIIGTLVGVFATVVEVKFAPPYWVHAALWIPFVIVGSLIALRLLKAALISAHYKVRPQDFD